MKNLVIFKSLTILIMIALFSCRKDNEPQPAQEEPEKKEYTGTVINEVNHMGFANVSIILEEAEIGTSKFLWWYITGPTGRYFQKDTFYTDAEGKYKFELNKVQRNSYNRLRFTVDNRYQDSMVNFSANRGHSDVTMYTYAFLKVNFKHYGASNRSCDYYFLDLYQDVKDSSYGSLITWSYGEKIPQEKIVALKPGKYYIRSKYSCGAYNGYERDSFNIIGLDTLEVKDLLSY